MARAMKDSGVEWIGEIPEVWQIGRIGQLYTERSEKVSDTEYQPLSVTMKGVLPQLSTAAKTDAHDDRKLVRVGDFAINSRSDRRGSCGISPYEGSVSLINTILMPRNEMHPVYYNWLFHSTMFSDEFYKWGHGIVNDLWTTNWQDMKRIAVPMPPFGEQSRIAGYLDTECTRIDAVIEQTRASIEEYKKLKQSVITQAVTKGIRPGRKMKDSGVEWIGEIPEEWHIDKIAKVASFHNGDRSSNYPSGDDIVDEGILFITSNNLGNIILNTDISSNKYITQEKYAAMRGAKLRINDIVFCLRGSVGKCSINKSFSEGTIASSLVVIRPECIDADFLNYALQNPQITELALLEAIGIGSQNLAASDIAGFKIPIPSEEDSESIVSYLKEKTLMIEKLIQKKVEVLNELESYKKSLIFEYVTGKKEVR